MLPRRPSERIAALYGFQQHLAAIRMLFMPRVAISRSASPASNHHGKYVRGSSKPFARITSFIRANGSVPGVQLAHAGRKASTHAPWKGGRPLAAGEGDRRRPRGQARRHDGETLLHELPRERLLQALEQHEDIFKIFLIEPDAIIFYKELNDARDSRAGASKPGAKERECSGLKRTEFPRTPDLAMPRLTM